MIPVGAILGIAPPCIDINVSFPKEMQMVFRKKFRNQHPNQNTLFSWRVELIPIHDSWVDECQANVLVLKRILQTLTARYIGAIS